MTIAINKGSTKFLFGFSDLNQFNNWIENNQNKIGVSFVGRSNVGKSSMINSIFGKKTARVSNTPGRTREINVFSFRLEDENGIRDDLPEFYLYDVPGYGFAQVSKQMQRQWDELMAVFFEKTSLMTLMVNLQDARHPNQPNDQAFHKFLKNFNYETYLVFNKMDKLKTQKERAALNKLKPLLFKEYKWVKQIHFASAESGLGVDQVKEAIVTYLQRKLMLDVSDAD